jgi:hypothetical protein
MSAMVEVSRQPTVLPLSLTTINSFFTEYFLLSKPTLPFRTTINSFSTEYFLLSSHTYTYRHLLILDKSIT